MKRLLSALLAAALASPAAAHEGHGAPGPLHGFSDEHGLALLAAFGVMGLTVWFRAPLGRMGARLRAPTVRLIDRYRSRS